MSALLLPICNPLSVEPPRDPNEYIDWLAARYPAVARLRDEHVQYFGDLLSHVLFGDITRYASELARRSHSDVSAQDELRALLRDLDDAIGDAEVGTDLEAKEEIDNVVWVSFVENASGIAGDPEEALRQEIRRFPGLAKALARLRTSALERRTLMEAWGSNGANLRTAERRTNASASRLRPDQARPALLR